MRTQSSETGKIYGFLGVGGASMSALCRRALLRGAEVFGYDVRVSSRTAELQRAGARIFYDEEISDEEKAAINRANLVVCTDAIGAGNSRYDECAAQGKKIIGRGEYLASVASQYEKYVAVAGSHGKTTCTAMCAHVFYAAKKRFSAHIGGEDKTFDNFCDFGDEFFVTEACEYKQNLSFLVPDLSVLLNVDLDHLECYDSESRLFEAFSRFCAAGKSGAIVCADDDRTKSLGLLKKYSSFGVENPAATYSAKNLTEKNGRYAFDFCERGEAICRVNLSVAGKCHVYNAVAAGAAARFFGLPAGAISSGLSIFRGVKRRFEMLGKVRGATWYCDYAHHPKEIFSAFETAKSLLAYGDVEDVCGEEKPCGATGKKIVTVFQPHTYSRTKNLFSQFVSALSYARPLLIFSSYAARESFDFSGSAQRLSQSLGAAYADCDEEMFTWISKEAGAGDIVLFLGAGDIYERAVSLYEKYGEKQS